jgi:hypothetical protein
MDEKYIENNAILRQWREVYRGITVTVIYYLIFTLPSQDILAGCIFVCVFLV